MKFKTIFNLYLLHYITNCEENTIHTNRSYTLIGTNLSVRRRYLPRFLSIFFEGNTTLAVAMKYQWIFSSHLNGSHLTWKRKS